MEEEGDIFALIQEECYYDDKWLEKCEKEENFKNDIDKMTKK